MNKKKENKKFQTLTRCIASTTYQLKVHFSENAKETVEDKIVRMIQNEIEISQKKGVQA